MLEPESLILKTTGNAVAAEDGEFRVRSHEQRGTDADHPGERRKADRHADRLAKAPHELLVRDGIGCGGDIDATHGFVVDPAFEDPIHVLFVDPAHSLSSMADLAAQAEPGDRAQSRESTSTSTDDETGS